MDKGMDEIGTLHVYAQGSWHDPAEIAGTREALEHLRDAITAAIESGKGRAEFFANDGEGYWLTVLSLPEAEMATKPSPYCDLPR